MNPPPVPIVVHPPRFEWDRWQRHALENGLSSDLATLGRAVMREASQHVWCDRLKAECGLSDDGRAMLARVLDRPERTAARWQWLLVTDGLRFDPWERHEFREDSPHWQWRQPEARIETRKLSSSSESGARNRVNFMRAGYQGWQLGIPGVVTSRRSQQDGVIGVPWAEKARKNRCSRLVSITECGVWNNRGRINAVFGAG